MNYLDVANRLIWAILLSESIVVFGLLLTGLAETIGHRRALRRIRLESAEILGQLQEILGTDDVGYGRSLYDGLRESLADARDGLRNLAFHLLARPVEHGELESLVGEHLGRRERGALLMCGFLARTAPLAGLAGTLFGVRHALASFARNPGQPRLVIEGFAYAVDTTIVAIVVSIVSLATARLLWERRLRATASGLLGFASTARGTLAAIRTKFRARQRRSCAPGTPRNELVAPETDPAAWAEPRATHRPVPPGDGDSRSPLPTMADPTT